MIIFSTIMTESYPLCHFVDNDPSFDELCIAAENNDIDDVKVLLSEGAQVNNRDCRSWRVPSTPIVRAAANNNIEMIKLLVDHRALVDDGSRDIPMIRAAKDMRPETAMALIDMKADVNSHHSGLTPLNMAVDHRNYELIEFLLASKANIYNGEYDVYKGAICNNDITSVRLMLESNVDPDGRHSMAYPGASALSLARLQKNNEMVELIQSYIDK